MTFTSTTPRSHGESHYAARLTDDLVAHLRREAAAGVPLSTLATLGGLNYGTIFFAIRGYTWKHIQDPPPVPPRGQRQAANARRHWTKREIQYVKRHLFDGDRVIARALGRTPVAIAAMRTRLRQGEFD